MIMTKNNPLKRVAASGASDRGDAAIYDLLGYNAIAKAGQPVSLTGESVIQLGALIAQMDFDDPLEEEVADTGMGAATVGTGTDYTSLDEMTLKYRDPVNTSVFNMPDLVSMSKKPSTVKPQDTPAEEEKPKEDTGTVSLNNFVDTPKPTIIRDTTGKGTSGISSMATDISGRKFNEQFSNISGKIKGFDSDNIFRDIFENCSLNFLPEISVAMLLIPDVPFPVVSLIIVGFGVSTKLFKLTVPVSSFGFSSSAGVS
jgi:hypothetical protein